MWKLKLLEKNIEDNLCALELGKGFLYTIPKPVLKKYQIEDLNVITMKNFCSSKDTGKRVKRQAETDRGTIFVSHIADKGFVYRIYTVLSKINKKTNNLKRND